MSEGNCPLCQSRMVWERRAIHYEREGFPVTLKNVWLRVCPECGHELVPGQVAIQLLNLAAHQTTTMRVPSPRAALTLRSP
jgi:YgiT-type zinc finger domain-containing protein